MNTNALDAMVLLGELAGLPHDQHGQRCMVMGEEHKVAVGYSLIHGWVVLKGISHKRVLVCISDEGFLAVRNYQRGYSQVLHGSTP